MTSEKCSIRAEFLEHPRRKIFHLLFEPGAGAAHTSVLFLHAFCDEMNMSRHIVASCARRLAESGCNVMVLDLTGCGDGAGEFKDADWSTWAEDAGFALDWLAAEFGLPVSVWGLRLGGLLAAQLAHNRTDVNSLLLWQPVLNGEQQIDQFLRLETAATAFRQGARFDRSSLWDVLRGGGSLEIAGYELPSQLAMEMSTVRLGDLSPQTSVHWLEINPMANPSAPAQNVISRWQDQGVQVSFEQVPIEPFWRSIDAVVEPVLEERTLRVMSNL